MIKVGIIGAGSMAHVHAWSISNLDSAQLVGVYDIEKSQAICLTNRFGGKPFASWQDLLASDIEAVVICTPTKYHKENIIKAVLANKHVLCEKPIALNMEEVKQIEEVANPKNILMVGHVLRFWPEYVTIKEIIESQDLGEVLQIFGFRLSGNAGESWNNWLLGEKRNLGVFDLHIHDLDFANWIFGQATSIYSKGIQSSHGVLTHVSSLLDYGESRYAFLEGSFQVPSSFPFTMHLRVILEKGALVFDFKGKEYHQGSGELLMYSHNGMERLEKSTNDPYIEEMKYFVDSILTKKRPKRGTVEDAGLALKTALAARKSIVEGKIIENPVDDVTL